MRGRHIVVFAGTAEGRRLVLSLCRRLPEGVVTASVATGWGRELLEAERPQNLRVREGRLDRGQIEAFLREERAGAVVDATHPYAREVSENLRAACGALELPCLGLAREETDGFLERMDGLGFTGEETLAIVESQVRGKGEEE